MEKQLSFDPDADCFIDMRSTKSINKFEALLPQKPQQLDARPKRIAVFDSSRKRNKIYLGLDPAIENEYSTALFLSIADGLLSPYFADLASNRHHLLAVRKFIDWLNHHPVESLSRYDVLNNFEAYIVNDCGLKTQSTGLERIISLIKNGLGSLHITENQYLYLLGVLESTSLSAISERTQVTLSSWFNLPWIRPIMGESSYLKLESPSLLMSSFRITVGTTLELLLNAKREIIALLSQLGTSPAQLAGMEQKLALCSPNSIDVDTNLTVDDLKCLESFNNLSGHDRKKYALDLFWRGHVAACLEKYNISSTTLQILKYDISNKSSIVYLNDWFKQNPYEYPPLQPAENGSPLKYLTKVPMLFTPLDLYTTNPLEETLASWLAACLMVQPEKVKLLQTSQFVREYNSSGSLISIFSRYFKGRGTRLHDIPTFDGSEIEGQAFESYLRQVEKSRNNLFTKQTIPAFRYVTTYQEGNSKPSYSVLLTKILKNKVIRNYIEDQHKKRKVDPIFLNAYLALDYSNAPSWDNFYEKHKDVDKPRELYKRTFADATPDTFFKLTHIKNSAVHSRYDGYREGDLVNLNSHTSEVEKLSYVNENNKDAINAQGRITRLVENDISNNLYRPSLALARKKAKDRILQTTLQKVSGTSNYEVNSLGVAIDENLDRPFNDEIIVLETKETMLHMIHYLNQVEKYGQMLLARNPGFFENAVLPTTIWMEHVVSQFTDKKMLAKVFKEYERLHEKLPNLFVHEMNGGVS